MFHISFCLLPFLLWWQADRMVVIFPIENLVSQT